MSSFPATLNVAGENDDSPRGCDPSLEVDFECESDEMADSGRTEQSPDHRQTADYEPSNEGLIRVDVLVAFATACSVPTIRMIPHRQYRHRCRHPHIFFYVRGDDDGVSHRNKSSCGTPASVGTTQGSEDNQCLISPLKRSRGFCQNG